MKIKIPAEEMLTSILVSSLWREGNWICNDGEEQANMGSLLCHLGPYNIEVCAKIKGHVYVYGSITAKVYSDAHGQCYHQISYRCQWFWSPPVATLVS